MELGGPKRRLRRQFADLDEMLDPGNAHGGNICHGSISDPGAHASNTAQGHAKTLGSTCSVDCMPATDLALRLRLRPRRNIEPHGSAFRKPKRWTFLQALKGLQAGRVKGDKGWIGLVDPADPA